MIHGLFLRHEPDEPVAAVRTCDRVELIDWEHKRITQLAILILGMVPLDQTWPDDRFDLVWVLRPDKSSSNDRVNGTTQLHLVGDLDHPI